jgi:transposase-like protein
MFSTLNAFEFQKQFHDTNSCLEYLAEMKWKDGYTCRKCGWKKFTKGYRPFSKRCQSCHYDETPTAHTMFHKLKFSLTKAFYGVFRYCRKKGMSSYELSKEMDISQKTAWLFHRKIQEAMASSGRYPLTGEVHVDEFVTGGPEKILRGRSYGAKKKSLIMMEVIEGNKTGRIYCRKIDDYKKQSIYPIIEQTVDKASKVVTDEFPTYDKLKELFPKAKQRRSANGSGFPGIHQQIMNLKGWLRGIHHHCSEHHFQHYLDEFCFKANRRNAEQGIFRSLMTRIASTKSKTFKELRAFAA